MNRVEMDGRLAELGVQLLEPKAAITNYASTVPAGGFPYISGQVAFKDDELYALGQVGKD